MNGGTFFTGKWTNPNWLIAETQKYYDEIPAEKQVGDRFSLAQSRIVDRREWGPAQRLIAPNLDKVIRELGIYYVPKTMAPGPCIVFPIRDYHQEKIITAHKINPFYELIGRGGPAKYPFLGEKPTEGKPSWLGDTDETLAAIAKYRAALLVEGPYDLVAVRLLHPGAPVLSSGTKRVNLAQVRYLAMLNVRNVYVMFDHEPGKNGREGAGDAAARYTVKEWNGKYKMQWQAVATLAEDPSDSLKDHGTALRFSQQLRMLFPVPRERKVSK